MNIEIEKSPSEKDKKALSQGIIDFNLQNVPELESIKDEVKFHIFVRDDSNNILGGLRANCYWNTLHIELLWLSENCRGKGVGKKLIRKAESFAVENKCEKAFVETTSWQAKPFYEKLGFEHIATLNDRPKGYASHYLKKNL